MSHLAEWAARWGIPDAAMADLNLRLGAIDWHADTAPAGRSEAAVQARARLKASARGWRLWRNNVGAVHDNERGVHVRFGLANDSTAVNSICKSGDLIGIRPMIVQPSDMGRLIGQFVSIECKPSDWKWTGTEREIAQRNWAALVTSLGGDARFLTDESQL